MPALTPLSKATGNRAIVRRMPMKTPTIGLLAALVLLTACNTVEGAGRDIESAGSAIENTAKDAKEDDGAAGNGA
jgi:predicted small secreted protein